MKGRENMQTTNQTTKKTNEQTNRNNTLQDITSAAPKDITSAATHTTTSAAMQDTTSAVSQTQHTFVIPAYLESPHLDACLWSLKQQTHQSNIVIVTSTPNSHIDKMADKYKVPVIVNPIRGSIATDWNFALEQGGEGLVTLAHQDDVYTDRYVESCVKAYEKNDDVTIIFTDYSEIIGSGGVIRGNTLLLFVKRLLLFPYQIKSVIRSRFIKRGVLQMGSPICCPSVCLNKSRLPDFQFSHDYTVNMDWDAWLRIAEIPGAMIYIPERFCLHRIHSGSETSKGIYENRRREEDLRIFKKIWPKPIAYAISKVYAFSYTSNQCIQDTKE